jgi:hypothetical protein
LKKPRAIGFGKENAPADGVEKNRDQMVNNDSQNCPFCRSKCIPDLADTLANQQAGEKRRASEAKQPYRHVYLAGCFHRLFESNSSRRKKMGLSFNEDGQICVAA